MLAQIALKPPAKSVFQVARLLSRLTLADSAVGEQPCTAAKPNLITRLPPFSNQKCLEVNNSTRTLFGHSLSGQLNNSNLLGSSKFIRLASSVWSIRRICASAKENYADDAHASTSEISTQTYACPKCEVAYSSQVTLNRHMTRKHLAKEIVCDMCPQTFVRKHSLYKHKWQDHERRYTCEACALSFESPKRMRFHMDCHHSPQKLFACYRCRLTFASEKELQAHQDLHLADKGLYVCRHCPRSFNHPRDLKVHLAFHDKNETIDDSSTFTCEKCGCAFKNQGILNRHLSRIHGVRGSKYKPRPSEH